MQEQFGKLVEIGRNYLEIDSKKAKLVFFVHRKKE